MKIILALILGCSILAACLSAPGARSLGYQQGLEGEAYDSILGKHANEHREGWVEGNAQFCRTVSYPALARSLRPIPAGVCAFSDRDLAAYCRAVDYAAFARADQDLPQACLPSSADQSVYQETRIAAFCTTEQAQRDLRSVAQRLWDYGACARDSSRRSCQRSSALSNAARDYCAANLAYQNGAQSVFVRAQSDAIQDASAELAENSARLNPTPADTEYRYQLTTYLRWAPDCDLRNLTIDC